MWKGQAHRIGSGQKQRVMSKGRKDKEERTDPLSDTRSGDEEAVRAESPSVTEPQGGVRESTDTKGHTQQPISQRGN